MRSKKSQLNKFLFPAILTLAALAGLIAASLNIGNVTLNRTIIETKLLYPLMRLIIFLGIGLLIGQILESTGWTVKIARWVRPVTKWSNLKDESAASFVTSFVSGIAANTMLVTFHQEGKIARNELILTYLLNNGLPMFLLHLPTTFFLVVSLAGMAGAVYIGITFMAALLRSVIILAICRFRLPKTCWLWSPVFGEKPVGSERTMTKIWKKFRDRFVRVALYTAPIYVIVFLLNEYGLFKWMRISLAGSVSAILLPVEAAGMVAFSLATEFGAGMAAAGALLSTGALTTKQAAVALIIGTILATPIRTLRHQVPTHLGLFDVGLGTKLLALGQGFRVMTLVLVTACYVKLF